MQKGSLRGIHGIEPQHLKMEKASHRVCLSGKKAVIVATMVRYAAPEKAIAALNVRR